jgi:hypothetical protein
MKLILVAKEFKKIKKFSYRKKTCIIVKKNVN